MPGAVVSERKLTPNRMKLRELFSRRTKDYLTKDYSWTGEESGDGVVRGTAAHLTRGFALGRQRGAGRRLGGIF